MDIKDIKEKIKSGFVLIKDKLKETLKLPYAKLYLILSIFVGIPFFVVVTFPFDSIIRNKLQEYANSDRTIQNIMINDIDFGLLGGFEMAGISITMENDKEIFMRELIVDSFLLPYQLLVSNKLDADIAINGLRFNSELAQVKLDLSTNIDISLDKAMKIPASGLINLMISSAEIKINEFQLPDSMLGLKIQLDPMKITAIDFKSNIANKKINIKTFKISGTDLSGSVNGNITISKRFMNSRIDLTINIDSKSKVIRNNKLIAENEMIKSQIDQMADSSGNIKIKLGGTLSRPRPNISGLSSRRSISSENIEIDKGEPEEKEMEKPDIINRKSSRRDIRNRMDRKKTLERLNKVKSRSKIKSMDE